MATSDDYNNNNKQTAFNLCQKSFGKGERCGWLFRVWVGIFFLICPRNFLSPKFFWTKTRPFFFFSSRLYTTPTQKKKANKKELEEEKDNDEAAAAEVVMGIEKSSVTLYFVAPSCGKTTLTIARARSVRIFKRYSLFLMYYLLFHSFIRYFFRNAIAFESEPRLKRDKFFVDDVAMFAHFAMGDHGAHDVDANS